MGEKFWDDWRAQGFFLLGNSAALAGASHHIGANVLCGLNLGVMVAVYGIMLASAKMGRP